MTNKNRNEYIIYEGDMRKLFMNIAYICKHMVHAQYMKTLVWSKDVEDISISIEEISDIITGVALKGENK